MPTGYAVAGVLQQALPTAPPQSFIAVPGSGIDIAGPASAMPVSAAPLSAAPLSVMPVSVMAPSVTLPSVADASAAAPESEALIASAPVAASVPAGLPVSELELELHAAKTAKTVVMRRSGSTRFIDAPPCSISGSAHL